MNKTLFNINCVAIIGLGAVGKIVCAGLLDAGIKCFFIDNRSIEQNRIIKYTVETPEHSLSTITISQLPLNIIPDLVILCTKTYQSISALQGINELLPSNVPILILQNGCGNKEMLQQFLPNPLYLATTTLGALKSSSKTIHTGKGFVYYESTINLKKCSSYRVPWIKANNIQEQLLIKLAINSVINPLTALLDIKNGEILEIFESVIPLVHEIYCIISEHLLETTESDLLNKIKEVASATANNYSSMHEDLKYGRRTEINAILGYLIKKAKKQHFNCCLINKLFQQINEREKKYESTDCNSRRL